MNRADAIIAQLQLLPHPEGGYYRETLRVPAPDGGRALATAIYFLLKEGEESAWHRVDAVEMWHFYAGAPLCLRLKSPGQAVRDVTLGADLLAGETPSHIVEVGQWQAARSLGEWTLVGCTVSPAFEFSGFELAPAGKSRAFAGELPE